MLISEYIREMFPEEKITVFHEKEIASLGLLGSKCESILSFAREKKFIMNLSDNISMLLISSGMESFCEEKNVGYIVCSNPQNLFWKLHESLKENDIYRRKFTKTIVSANADISPLAYIAERNVVIEDDVIIEPFVCIYENCVIKKGSVIRSGAKIGCTGFQETKIDGTLQTISHIGGVIIGENVDIKNNSIVDSSIFPWENTIIGDETKIDSFVKISHGCKIGKRNLIAAGTILAGIVVVGDDCWFGLTTTIRNGLVIGNNVRVNMGSVLVNDLPDGAEVSGNYAIDHKKFLYNHLRNM